MHDNMKMMNVICEEIDKIAEKGLTTSNLETAYKLIDMYKDLKTVDAMDEAGYSETMAYENYPMSMNDMDSMARGRGRYAKRASMGRYSREGDMGMSNRGYAEARYSQAKMDYRNSRAGKKDVLDSLEEKMKELKNELKEMSRDSDFPEERQKIDKYVEMIERMER